MEEHRLIPMPEGYDKTLFNEIYKQTTGLRKALAYQIDARRFGVDQDEILSWFDIKFIHAFSQYWIKYDEEEKGNLKGYVINALRTFKYRVMKEAYAKKNLQFQNTIDITEIEYFENIISTTPQDEKDHKTYELFLESAMGFMKKRLTDDAYLILEIQLDTPLYILNRLENPDSRSLNLPNEILAEYLGFPISNKILSYVADLKREIKHTLEEAKEFFSVNPVTTAVA
jgi:hypothetical protein